MQEFHIKDCNGYILGLAEKNEDGGGRTLRLL